MDAKFTADRLLGKLSPQDASKRARYFAFHFAPESIGRMFWMEVALRIEELCNLG